MRTQLAITDARKQFSGMVDQVRMQGNTYVIIKHGKPAAAVVPVAVLDKWEEEREELFAAIRRIQKANADVDPDQVMEDVLYAQQAVRAEAKNTP